MQLYRHRISRLIFASVTAGFLVLVIAAVSVVLLLQRTQDNYDIVTHTLEVKSALANLQFWIERTETARRGFLIENDERFATAFETNAAEAKAQIERLRALVDDNPDQTRRLEALGQLQLQHVTLLRDSIADRRRGGTGVSAASIFDAEDIAVIRTIRAAASEMVDAEDALFAVRVTRLGTNAHVTYGVMAATGILLVLVAAGTIWGTRRNVRELASTGEQLRLLNDDLEAAVSVRTAELQRANDEIQRFAYIVSHDLRSPLVNVMGFTSELDAATRPLSELIRKIEADAPDLVSEEARLAVDEDLPEAIGFIRSSTQKMDRLINAILRLSREGRRVLTPERLEMDNVVKGIVDSLSHRLSEIGAEIEVETLPNLISDRVAVEQIFSNLIENSVKYLKAGRPGRVAVRGLRRGGRLVYEVSDNGRGIDPKDHDRIFDLFRRSGSQDQPGEGIGLAHVRALAYRLGGVIECESKLDEGATFRLSIPLHLGSA